MELAICPIPTTETQLVLSSNVHLQEGLTSVKLLLVTTPSRHPWSICSAYKGMSQIPLQSLSAHAAFITHMKKMSVEKESKKRECLFNSVTWSHLTV